MESSAKLWSTGGENGKPLQYSCRENPMNSMKRQKDTMPEDESPRLVGVQYATGEELRNSSKRVKRLGQSRNDTQLWMCLVVRVKSDESYHEYVLIYFESDPLSSPSLPNPEHHQQSLGSCSSPCFWHPLPLYPPNGLSTAPDTWDTG